MRILLCSSKSRIRVSTGLANPPCRISDLYFGPAEGTVQGPAVAAFQCSGKAPCTGITVIDNDFKIFSNHSIPTGYLCSNVDDPVGFNCTADCGPQDENCPS